MSEYKRLTDSVTAVMLKNTEGSSWDSEDMEAQRYIRLAELENKIEQGTMIELKELKKAFWQYIGRHGIVVTNGNIDFVVYDCLKELQNEHKSKM